MNILFCSSELSPYAKTGGLGDVLAALPAALQKRGHSVSCVIPFYRCVAERLKKYEPTDLTITVPLGGAQVSAQIVRGVTEDGVRLFMVRRDEYFDRSQLYGTPTGDYSDNASRFIFFDKVVVELARYIKPTPHIIHAHDWQTGLVPALVRAAGAPFRCVYTIHNLAYQGSFWAFDFDLTNLPGEYFSPPGVEFYGRLNLMKAALVLSHQITTVSPRYAEEIQTAAFGCALDAVLRENKHKLTGILNGVDYGIWDPSKDAHLPATFNTRSLKGKKTCKEAILKEFNLPQGDQPLFGCISRLAGQKGFDLLAEVLDEFLEQDVKLVLLGSGDAHFQDYFKSLAERFPDKVGVKIGFDEALAHRIEAGSDFFLMPSRFEPCGLNQMYSLRYGAIPIVHETGGLADSVQDINLEAGTGTGFKFWPYENQKLRQALARALDLYQNKTLLQKIRIEGMKQTFSWDVSAAQYEKVYEKALI